MAKLKLNWPEDRWHEFNDLRDLLTDAESLNHANCVIERMQRLIDMATSLTRWDRKTGRKSFVAFLEDLAIGREE